MTRPFALLLLSALTLAACREETAELPPPVEMTAEAVGHYCQMNILEHPGPKAQAHLDGMPAPLFFSQVRDLVAYLRMPEQSHVVTIAYVSDMGAPEADWDNPGVANWIAAETAHYVVGSPVAGGMGAPETVPFSTARAAQAFAERHGGTVMTLAQIPDTAVLAPVDQGDATAEADFLHRLHALSTAEGN